MTMYVYKSNRAESLLEALAAVLRRPAGGPFQPETVVVHSQGVERWLSMELSQRLGVAAGISFPFPGRLVRTVFSEVLGERAEGAEVWEREPLTWAVLRVLPEVIGAKDFAQLRAFLRDDPELQGPNACGLARRIADTFGTYLVFRQEMVLDWSRGGGQGWQPVLWRALEAHLGAPHHAALARELFAALERPEVELGELPRRICLFGISLMAPFNLRVMAALSRHLEVHLLMHSPSQEFWADVRAPRRSWRLGEGAAEARPDAEEQHWDEGHLLLASLGRLSRDFQDLLESEVDYVEPLPDLFVDPASGPEPTMLRRLQSDMLHLHNRGGRDGPAPCPLRPDDRSISVHSCHGGLRQVEVLRDQLLECFRTLPDLQPRDVVVMTPDIETFGPLIEAVFDRSRDDDGFLPYRVADRALRRQSPVADAFLQLLDLPGSRLTASQVLDFLALGPVHQRFGIDDEELEQIIGWVSASGIRWGIDADHRRAHDQPRYGENTWRFGLDRLLLGYAMPGDDRALFGDVLPFDEVEGGLALLAGKLAELCDALFRAIRELERGPRTLPEWRDLLSQVLADLMASTSDTAWEHEAVRVILSQLAEGAEEAGFEGRIELRALAAELTAELEQNPEPTGFLSGQLTFCAMVPLRNIPFRVVCLLGLDDGAFPRSPPRVGFDKMSDEPRRGDRTPRDDDRQLFLESLLAARDRVVITFSGQSPHDNTELPPSVVVSELIDALSGAFVPPGGAERAGEDLRDLMARHLVVRHPLQPFSPRCFGEARDPRLFSYSRGYLEGARALGGERQRRPPFWVAPLDPPKEDPPTLDVLVRFFEDPTRNLLERRLRLRLRDEEALIEDQEPAELNNLQRWSVAQPLVERALSGEDLRGAYRSVRGAGVLPWGTPGECLFQDLVAEVLPVSRAVQDLCRGERRDPIELDLRLGEGLRLQGRIDDLWPRGMVHFRYAKLKARYLLRLWINHLALCCRAEGEPPWQSWLIVRGQGGTAAEVYSLLPVDEPEPELIKLIRLREQGLREPLLFFPESSWAYASEALADPSDPAALSKAVAKAKSAWGGGYFDSGEADDPAVRRVYGDAQRLPFEPGFSLTDGLVPPDLSFHQLALDIYRPLARHLERLGV